MEADLSDERLIGTRLEVSCGRSKVDMLQEDQKMQQKLVQRIQEEAPAHAARQAVDRLSVWSV